MGSNCNGLKLQWASIAKGSIAKGSITDLKKAARIAPGGLFENPPAGLRTGQGGQR
jgi:hypothetical protein